MSAHVNLRLRLAQQLRTKLQKSTRGRVRGSRSVRSIFYLFGKSFILIFLYIKISFFSQLGKTAAGCGKLQ